MDYSPWGHKELDMIEGLAHTHTEMPEPQLYFCFYSIKKQRQFGNEAII